MKKQSIMKWVKTAGSICMLAASIVIAGRSVSTYATNENVIMVPENDKFTGYHYSPMDEKVNALLEATPLTQTGAEDELLCAVTFEDYIVSELESMPESITVSSYGISADDFSELYWSVLAKHPELYYVSSMYSYYYNSSNIVTRITPTYGTKYDEALFEAQDKKLLDKIDSTMTDMEKVLVIHDYLCLDVEYNYSGYLNGTTTDDDHCIVGSILKKKSVCDGYSSAFVYYCNKLGIPCYEISGKGNGGGHAWNQVYVNGAWYLLDVTWDDPVEDLPGRASHTYFMKSPSNFGNHSWDQTAYPTCSSTVYDSGMIWDGVNNAFIYNNSNWYYLDSSSNIKKHTGEITKSFASDTTIKNISAFWYVMGSQNSFYSNQAKIIGFNNKIYYSQPKGVYACNFDGTGVTTIVDATSFTGDGIGYIYGMKIQDNQCVMMIKESPNVSTYTLKTVTLATEKKEQTITTSRDNYSKVYNDSSFSLEAGCKGGTLTYSSSNSSVVTVTSSGIVSIKGAGTAQITISTTGNASYKGATKTVTITVAKATPVLTVEKSFSKTYGSGSFYLGATTSSRGELKYATKDASVVTVSSSGKVTLKGAGTTTVVVKSVETDNYRAISKSVTIAVNRKKITDPITISTTTCVYNKSEKKPRVRIGSLVEGRDFTVEYTNNVNIGTATITATGMGNYKGTVTKNFKIVPPNTSITSLASIYAERAAVKWSTTSACDGYQIRYSTDPSFTTYTRVTVPGNTTYKKSIFGLTSGKTYYFMVRSYKVVDGVVYYGNQSEVVSVKVK